MSPEIFSRFWEALPIGLISGLLSGAFGVGGGIIATPMCRYILGIAPHIAIGSILAFIVPTALVGAYNYARQDRLIWPLALVSGVPAVLSTIVGSTVSHYVNGSILMVVVCAVMFLSGLDFSLGLGEGLKKSLTEDEVEPFRITPLSFIQAASIGALVGFMSGMLGVGGGFLLIPCYCYFFRLTIKDAFGTSLIVICMVALLGAIVHGIHGHVDLTLAAPMILGSMPGAWIGSRFALKARDRVLKLVFGALLICSAVYFATQEISLLQKPGSEDKIEEQI